MTGRLPQLLDQLTTWLHGQLHAGRLRVDSTAHTGDAAEVITAIAARLTQASHCAHRLDHVLDTAHQHAAHLATAP